MNKQPYYHKLTLIFTATDDVSDDIDTPEFIEKLEAFLKSHHKSIRKGTLEVDECDAEAGDPSDLL